MPEYAAYLMNRLKVGEDGKVPYQRFRGKKPSVLSVEFGEKLFYKVKIGNKLQKIKARWKLGIFVGVKWKNGEIIVANQEGVTMARTVRRIPVEKRWSKDSLRRVKWAPWHRYTDAEGADGDVPAGVPEEEEKERGVQAEKEKMVFVKVQDTPPRGFQIRWEDRKEFGATRGCPGCNRWEVGRGRAPHSKECIRRFEECLKGRARFENQKRRMEEYIEEQNKKKKEESPLKEIEEGRKRKAGEEDEDRRTQWGGGAASGIDRGSKRKEDQMDEVGKRRIAK